MGDVQGETQRLDSSLKSANGSVLSFAASSTLLNAALNIGILTAVNVAIQAIVAAWDKLNVTMEEAQQEIDNVTAKQQELISQRDQLVQQASTSGISAADSERLNNLKKEIEYNKELLAIKEKEYQQNSVGTSWTDLFDSDSLKSKRFKEDFGTDNLNLQAGLENHASNYYDEVTKSLEEERKALEECAEGSGQYQVHMDNIETLNLQQAESVYQLTKSYDDLVEKRAEYAENAAQAEAAISSGALSGEDLKEAYEQKSYWDEKVKGATALIDDARAKLDAYNQDVYTIDAKMPNVSVDELLTLSDEERQILATLNVDPNTSFDEVKEKISEAQEYADKESVKVGIVFEENGGNIDDFQSKASSLHDALEKVRSGELDSDSYIDLLQEFPELADSADDLGTGIEELIDGQLDALLEQLGDDVPPELRDSLIDIAETAKEAEEPVNDLANTLNSLSDVEGDMSSLGSIYEKYSTGTGSASLEDLGTLQQNFGELEGFDSFIDTITNASSSMDEIQEAFNGLTEEYLNQQGVLDSLNFANAEYMANQLQELGIANAYEVVLATLGVSQEQYAQIKAYCAANGIDMANITYQEIQAMLAEGTISETTAQAMYAMALQKALANESALDTSADIDNLILLVDTLKGTTDSLEAYKNAVDGAGKNVSEGEMNRLKKAAEEEARKALERANANKAKTVSMPKIDFQGPKMAKEMENAAKSAGNAAKSVGDEVKDAAEEARKALDELMKKFDELEKGYDLRLKLFDDRDGKIQDAIKLTESQGNLVGKAFYEELINSQNEQIRILSQKRADLERFLNDSVSSGQITEGTEQWYKMVQAVEDTKDEIMKCTINAEEFQNKLNELHWERFEKFTDRLKGLESEIQNVIGILSDKEVADESTGEWTNEGLTAIAMYGEAYELAVYQANEYKKQIDYLNAAYQRGEYSQLEYQERLQELKDAQWDAIQAAEEAKKGIVDLNKARVEAIKKGINKEIDAMAELIDKKKEALDIEKDTRDFKNSVEEKEEEIFDLQRQLNGLATDDSQEAAAKRKKIQAELMDAQKELEEIYYEESIDQQKAALDQQLEDFKVTQENKIAQLEESLTDEETLIAESLELVRVNHESVYTTLTQMGQEYGVTLSTAITEPWQSAQSALAAFSDTFGEKVSGFTEQLGNIKNKFEEIGRTADDTAQKITNMIEQAKQVNYVSENSGSGSSGSSGGTGGASGGSGSSGKRQKRYYVVNYDDKKILDTNGYATREEAEKALADKVRTYNWSFTAFHVKYMYASGTRHAHAGLARINELGPESIFARTQNGDFRLMSEGDQVFTKLQTDNLYHLSKLPASMLTQKLRNAAPGMPISLSSNTNAPSNVDIKCPIYIQGNVDDTNVKKIQKQIDSSIQKAVGRMNSTLYKAGARRA